MDLIVPHRKSRFRQINLCCAILFLVACLHISVVHSWRITQKCPHGHYFNDGCTACWCDISTGQTKCERLQQCTRITPSDVKCPKGRQYKDKCGNDCTCYESTGAVFCNEKRRCPHDDTKPPFQIMHSTTVSSVGKIPPIIITKNTFLRRNGGILEINNKPLPPTFVSSTPIPPPPPMDNNFQGFHSRMGEIESDNNNERVGGISVSSTPRPHLKIPVSNSRSEELIIEPAIIIRKKGSNKASVVRNPSSAASVHLTHSNVTPRSAPSLAPLQLYESQLRRILDIKRAYTNLLRSKVNLNLQIASGKTPMQMGSSSQQNLPFNRIVVLQEKNNNQQMDHPRRFDENYFGNNSSTSITPRTPFPIQAGQTVKPLIWRKEIKKVLNNFSPVPPLKQLVNYVTTSTESYLSQFLNHLNKNRMDTGIVSMTSPRTMGSTTTPPPPPPPPTVPPAAPSTLPPSVTYPYSSFSTIEPFHESNSDHSSIPIHEVYQNHNFKILSTATPGPMPFSYNSRSGYHSNHPPRFPYMTQLMEEIVRVDQNGHHTHHNGYVPIPTPRTSPALTALPTFHTPGPPYAEIDVVQPLSFLPPPNPEPATPTRRTMITSNGVRFSLPPPRPPPTVRVNIDKPIYITPPPPQNNRYVPPPPPRPPIFPPPQHNRRLYSTYPMNTHQTHNLPTHQNNFNSYHYQPERQPPPPPPPLHQDPFRNYQQNPPQFRPSPLPNYQNYPPPPPRIQYFIPNKRPKQYRLTLKGSMREAATRVDDVVPRFVSRIANEFFKKPEIYVPKFRPGKPLTLERVILNHKEIVPKEVSFGGVPTKLRFSPEAQWTMKEDMAKQGIMINEPLISSHPTILPGDNVMELDAPVRAVQSWETHTKMNVGTMQNTRKGGMVPTEFRPILLPSPVPSTEHPPTLDYQHQQELQHQLLLAQQNLQNQLFMSSTTAAPPMDIFNDHQFSNHHNHDTFSVDTSDYNDWNKSPPEFYPNSENGEEQIIVDKYVVHDPNDGTNHDVIITTTTAAPPIHDEISPYFFNHNMFHKTGYPTVPAPTPPSVLIRHHGAPSPTTTEAPPMPLIPQLNHNSNNNKYFVTVINSTPSPIPFVTTTISPIPSVGSGTIAPITGGSIAEQIHEMLHDQMDFGARPQQNVYDFLFQSRTGTPPPVEQDQMTAAATKMAGEVEEEKDKIDTEKVANIFSMDYKQSVGRKPPEVIVIRVPADHSDGPFPKVVGKRGDAVNVTTEKPIVTTTIITSTTTASSKSIESEDDQDDEPEEDDSAEERRRKRKRKRRRRKKKKKSKARRRETVEESDEREATTTTSTTEKSTSSTVGSVLDGEAEVKFQKELDWKSQLMANICDINPSSPLCLTYRSICLLMTSEEAD